MVLLMKVTAIISMKLYKLFKERSQKKKASVFTGSLCSSQTGIRIFALRKKNAPSYTLPRVRTMNSILNL